MWLGEDRNRRNWAGGRKEGWRERVLDENTGNDGYLGVLGKSSAVETFWNLFRSP